MFIFVVLLYDDYSNFKKGHSNLGTRYRQHGTCSLNRVRSGCAMVAKPGTIVLIMKMASEVGPLSLCCCMKFLISNDFGGRLSAKPASLPVRYSSTRTWIYKSTAYRRERTSGKTLGGHHVYKYLLVLCIISSVFDRFGRALGLEKTFVLFLSPSSVCTKIRM